MREHTILFASSFVDPLENAGFQGDCGAENSILELFKTAKAII
jgi:hypothetical protein